MENVNNTQLGLLELLRLLEISGQRDKFSPLHLPRSSHVGVVPQMFNKQDLDISIRKSRAELSLFGRKFIFHSKMMKHDTLEMSHIWFSCAKAMIRPKKRQSRLTTQPDPSKSV